MEHHVDGPSHDSCPSSAFFSVMEGGDDEGDWQHAFEEDEEEEEHRIMPSERPRSRLETFLERSPVAVAHCHF